MRCACASERRRIHCLHITGDGCQCTALRHPRLRGCVGQSTTLLAVLAGWHASQFEEAKLSNERQAVESREMHGAPSEAEPSADDAIGMLTLCATLLRAKAKHAPGFSCGTVNYVKHSGLCSFVTCWN